MQKNKPSLYFRFLSTLLVVSISLGLTLPGFAYALRAQSKTGAEEIAEVLQSVVGQADGIALELTGGFEEKLDIEAEFEEFKAKRPDDTMYQGWVAGIKGSYDSNVPDVAKTLMAVPTVGTWETLLELYSNPGDRSPDELDRAAIDMVSLWKVSATLINALHNEVEDEGLKELSDFLTQGKPEMPIDTPLGAKAQQLVFEVIVRFTGKDKSQLKEDFQALVTFTKEVLPLRRDLPALYQYLAQWDSANDWQTQVRAEIVAFSQTPESPFPEVSPSQILFISDDSPAAELLGFEKLKIARHPGKVGWLGGFDAPEQALIVIRSDLGPIESLVTAAHECCHLAQAAAFDELSRQFPFYHAVEEGYLKHMVFKTIQLLDRLRPDFSPTLRARFESDLGNVLDPRQKASIYGNEQLKPQTFVDRVQWALDSRNAQGYPFEEDMVQVLVDRGLTGALKVLLADGDEQALSEAIGPRMLEILKQVVYDEKGWEVAEAVLLELEIEYLKSYLASQLLGEGLDQDEDWQQRVETFLTHANRSFTSAGFGAAVIDIASKEEVRLHKDIPQLGRLVSEKMLQYVRGETADSPEDLEQFFEQLLGEPVAGLTVTEDRPRLLSAEALLLSAPDLYQQFPDGANHLFTISIGEVRHFWFRPHPDCLLPQYGPF